MSGEGAVATVRDGRLGTCGLVALQTQHNTRLRNALHEARQMGYATDIFRAWRAYTEDDFGEFEQIINRYREGQPLAEYRGLEYKYLERLTRIEGREMVRLPQPVYQIDFTPRGDSAALLGADAIVRIVEYPTGRAVTEWETNQIENNGGVFTQDGRTLWTTGDDGTLRAWDVASHAELLPKPIIAHPNERAFEVLFDAKRNLLITCGTEGTIRAWDAATGESRGEFSGHERTVQTLAWHPDGDRILSASNDATARVWNVETRRETARYRTSSRVFHATISPDGTTVALCSEELLLASLSDHDLPVRVDSPDRFQRAAFDSESRMLFALTESGHLNYFDLRRDDDHRVVGVTQVAARRVHGRNTNTLVPDRTGVLIATSGDSGNVSTWPVKVRDHQGTCTYSCERVGRFVFHPDGKQLAAVSPTGVYVWSVNTGRDSASAVSAESARIVGAGERWRRVAFSPKGALIAGGTTDGTVEIWHSGSLQRLGSIDLGDDTVTALSCSHDGRSLAAAINYGPDCVFVLDARTGEVRARFVVGRSDLALFSPVEPLLAVTSYGNAIWVVNTATDAKVWQSDVAAGPVSALCFSPDGQWLLSAFADRVVRVFDAHSGKLIKELHGHLGPIQDVCISPDGRTIGTRTEDGVMRMWHAATGRCLFEFTVPRAQYAGAYVLFSPDGRWLANNVAPGAIRLVPLD